MQEDMHSPLRLEKTLVYSCVSTFKEFVAASPRQEFMEMRLREIRLLAEEQAYFTEYPDPTNWLVIASHDSPDTLVVLPVLAHLAAWAPRLTLRVVCEEEAQLLLSELVEDEELVAQWQEIELPLLLTFDEEWQFQEKWGPHPQAIDAYFEEWMAVHSDYEQLSEDDSATGRATYNRLLEKLLLEMRMWYNSTLNQACGEELSALLARWHVENGDEA